MAAGTPGAEVVVTAELVRALIADQHSQYAHLPIRLCGEGWDNFIFRLGDALAVRLPRRKIAEPLLAREQRFLPAIATRLSLPVPVAVAKGQPGRGYPWGWSICRWVDGAPVDTAPLDGRQGPTLAAFLRGLHQPADDAAPANPARGALADRVAETTARLERLRKSTDLIAAGVERAWRDALAAAPYTGRVWLHGDLHAQNVLSNDGALAGVIDWGDMCGGDPAVDLGGVWGLLGDADARAEAIAAYAPSPDLKARAKGWAVVFGAVVYEHGHKDNPRHAAMGAATLRCVAEDS